MNRGVAAKRRALVALPRWADLLSKVIAPAAAGFFRSIHDKTGNRNGRKLYPRRVSGPPQRLISRRVSETNRVAKYRAIQALREAIVFCGGAGREQFFAACRLFLTPGRGASATRRGQGQSQFPLRFYGLGFLNHRKILYRRYRFLPELAAPYVTRQQHFECCCQRNSQNWA